MKSTIILLLIALLCCGSVLEGMAQGDTSSIDPGWLSLDKGFTQTVTIKGEDLEKMPFTNLSDAIAAWLYSAYTVPGTLAYVVDGNPVTDVNIYPIFDIREVMLVESAVGSAAYGATQQELVLITTRREKGKSGIKAAAQAGPVNANGKGVRTTTNFYHQYYLGGYWNGDRLSGGISADWVRDVAPLPTGEAYHVITPENLQRLRLNGFLAWRPTKKDLVGLRIGYAPERIQVELDSIYGQNYEHVTSRENAHVLAPEVRWSSEPVPGLRNDLLASYTGNAAKEGIAFVDSTGPFGVEDSRDTLLARVSHLRVAERLSYELAAGGWHILPTLNFSYDHITEKTARSSDSIGFGYAGQFVIYNLPVGPWQEDKGDLLYLTPAVDFRLARALDLQVGARMNLSGQRDVGSNHVLPFATAGFDVLHFGRQTEGASLKLFGSYAQRSTMFLNDYSLDDLAGGGMPYSLANVYQTKTSAGISGGFAGGGPGTSGWVVTSEAWPVFWDWQAGAAYTTASGRLQLQYTFERRNFVTPGGVTYLYSTGDGLQELSQWTSDMHHADIRFKAVNTTRVSWETGLNVTLLKSKNHIDVPSGWALTGLTATFYSYQASTIGDIDPAHLSYTGGWVNRVRVGPFNAGLDVLYHFGQVLPEYNGAAVVWTGPKTNSVVLSHVYLGYGLRLPAARTLELFVESRGLARSKTSDLDDRRFYTIGGKFTM